MNVVIDPAAHADLESIRDAISERRPAASRRIVSAILEQIRLLRRYPRMGRVIPELGQDRFREISLGNS